MSVVFFAPGMAGAATRRGAGIHALLNVHRRTPSQSGSSRQVAAGYRMTAAVGGNPCKRLQATLAPCGSLSQISGGSPRGYVRTTRRGKRQKAPSRLDHQRWKGLLKRKSDRENKKA